MITLIMTVYLLSPIVQVTYTVPNLESVKQCHDTAEAYLKVLINNGLKIDNTVDVSGRITCKSTKSGT